MNRKIGQIVRDTTSFGDVKLTDIYISETDYRKGVYEIEVMDSGMITYATEEQLDETLNESEQPNG